MIDPRRLQITKDADLWIKPRPSSDAVLAYGILKYIIDNELYDKEFVKNWTVGFDKLQKELERFTLDDVARITWVPRQQIEQVARWYGELQPGAITVGMGAMRQQVQGFQGERVLDILRGIVTPQNLPDWGKHRTPSQTVPGGMLYLLDKLPRKIDLNLAKEHPYAVRSAYIPDQALCNGIRDGKIKAAIFTQCDPLITYPNARKTYDTFMKLDLLVMMNIFMVPTAAISDIVLPVATAHECDTIICGTNGASPHAVPKLIEPPGEARSDVTIINDLAQKMGLGKYFFDSDVDSINYLLGPSGQTWEELKKIRVLEGKTEEIPEDTGYFNTPSGKLEILSQRAMQYGANPLPLWQDVQPTWDPTEAYPLLLASREVDEFRLSAWRHVKYLRKRVPYPRVQLHPDTAKKAGAKDGDWVWIESKMGRIMQKLTIDPEVDPRVVMTTFGWYYPEDPSNAVQWDKSNINILIPDEPVEPTSGATNTKGYPCRVYKADDGEVNLPDFIEGIHAVGS